MSKIEEKKAKYNKAKKIKNSKNLFCHDITCNIYKNYFLKLTKISKEEANKQLIF